MSPRKRLVAALSVALLSAVACIALVIEPQWFELLFADAPDGGDGSVETVIAVAVSLVACVLFAWLARREWREWRQRQRNAAASASSMKRQVAGRPRGDRPQGPASSLPGVVAGGDRGRADEAAERTRRAIRRRTRN